MVKSSSVIDFTEQQMDGIYDTGAYRAYLGVLSDLEDSQAAITEYRAKKMSDTIPYDENSVSHRLYLSAAMSIYDSLSAFAEAGIDTMRTAMWVALHDMLVSVCVLVTVPGFEVDGEDCEYLIDGAMLVLDHMTRAASARVRHLAPLNDGSDEEVESRIWAMKSDFLCGRAAGWLSCVDDLGSESGVLCGISYGAMLDAHQTMRFEGMVETLSKFFDMSEETSISRVIQWMMAAARAYDELQEQHFNAVFSNGYSDDFVPQTIKDRMFDDSVAEAMRDKVVMEPDTSPTMRGYCKLLGVHPVRCVATLPREVLPYVCLSFDELELL